MRRDFKIDLILWMQDLVLKDKGINLINTATDVKRINIVYRETHGYLRHYVMAAYDIIGVSSGELYTIRVYARFGQSRYFSSDVTDLTPTVEDGGGFSYNMWIEEPKCVVYKLWRRFPLIGNCPISPACFCSHSAMPKLLRKLDGTPLCPKVGHLPTITLIGEATQTYPYGTFFSDPGATAYDLEDGDLSYALITRVPDEIYTTGTHEVVYEVTDYDNNTVQAVRVVVVLPFNHGPSITLLPYGNESDPIHIPWGFPVSDIPSATAIDFEDGDISSDITVSGNLNSVVAGSYTLTYSVTDSGGKSATKEREVIVGENLVPSITLLPDADGNTTPIEIPYGSDLSVIPGATASDPEDGDITPSIVAQGLPNTLSAGTYTVTYTATDSGGLTISTTREVVVRPNLAPVVTLLANSAGDTSLITIPQWSTWEDPGATAYDEEDGDVTSSIVVTGTVDTSVAGTNTITYRATDRYNVYGMAVRQVIVVANASPTITLLANSAGDTSPITIPYLSTWEDPGATASDAEDGDLTNVITISGDAVDNTASGEYRIVYTVTDSHGLSASVTRIVNVADNVGPIITLVGDSTMEIMKDATFTDPGALAGDEEEGDITANIVVSGDTVDTSTVGTYSITYTITDSGGLSASVTRIVTVEDVPETLTLRLVPPADASGYFDGGPYVYYSKGEDQIWDMDDTDNRFVRGYVDNILPVNEGGEAWGTDLIQQVLQNVCRLENTVAGVEAALDAAQAAGRLDGLLKSGTYYSTGSWIVPITLTKQAEFITTNINSEEQLNYDVTLDAASAEEAVYSYSLHIVPATGYQVEAISSVDGDVSNEIEISYTPDMYGIWIDPEKYGGDMDITTTFSITHNGISKTLDVVQKNHFSAVPDIYLDWDWVDHVEPLRTRVWKIVPVTSEDTNYLKHIKLFDTDGNDVLLGGAVGILGPVLSGGRVYLNDENITIPAIGGGTLPKHAIADMTATGEVGYIIEGNNTKPIEKLTIVGIDNPDQNAYPQAVGFKLYVGDMVGHVGNDSMLYDAENVNWTLVHETSVDIDPYWSANQTRDYVFDEPYMPTYTPWVEPGYSAYDTYGNIITNQVVIDDTVDIHTPGSYTVTYSVTDYSVTPSGDTATATRTVIITEGKTGITLGSNDVDTQGDFLRYLKTAGTAWIEPNNVAIDVVDGDISGDIIYTPVTFDPTTSGVYDRSFRLVNNRGQTSYARQLVDVDIIYR